MLSGYLTQLSGLFDRRFILAYFSPVFIVLALLGLGGAAAQLGPSQAAIFWAELNPVMQIVLGLAALIAITVLAYVLQALTTPLVRLYEGFWPEWLAQRAKRKHLAAWEQLSQESFSMSGLHQPGNYRRFYFNYPRDEDFVRATRLGNTLAAAEDYPHQVYRLDSVLWWPRLTPLLPEDFRGQIDAALTPMLALINLSFLFAAAAILGGLGVLISDLFFADQPIWLFVLVFAGGLLLAWFCYQGAVSQAAGYGNLIRVAFDLYRHEILKQMRIDVPDNLMDEGELWTALNQWVYQYTPPWEANLEPDGHNYVPTDNFFFDNYKPPSQPQPDKPQQIVLEVKGSPTLHLKQKEGDDA